MRAPILSLIRLEVRTIPFQGIKWVSITQWETIFDLRVARVAVSAHNRKRTGRDFLARYFTFPKCYGSTRPCEGLGWDSISHGNANMETQLMNETPKLRTWPTKGLNPFASTTFRQSPIWQQQTQLMNYVLRLGKLSHNAKISSKFAEEIGGFFSWLSAATVLFYNHVPNQIHKQQSLFRRKTKLRTCFRRFSSRSFW